MRVIAGTARSMPLKTISGLDTRPTTDRIKETLFNMLMPYIPDSDFLDLFAGSGQIGIEALSRGARSAVFVDNAKAAQDCIKDNLKFTRFSDKAVVTRMDVLSYLSTLKLVVSDLIFMDAPYESGLNMEALRILGNKEFKYEDTLIVCEDLKEADYSEVLSLGYEIVKEKIYKTNKHIFIRKAGEEKADD